MTKEKIAPKLEEVKASCGFIFPPFVGVTTIEANPMPRINKQKNASTGPINGSKTDHYNLFLTTVCSPDL